jgi:uncharacterized protein (TIGR00369 family)
MPSPDLFPGNSTLDERANHCFGCGTSNPQGLHLSFEIDAADPSSPSATAQARLDRRYEGPPGYLHGGLIATLLDEAMSKLNEPLRLLAITRNIQIDYLRPVPLHKPILITGRHHRREGRSLYHTANITLPNGTLLARAAGQFVILAQIGDEDSSSVQTVVI